MIGTLILYNKGLDLFSKRERERRISILNAIKVIFNPRLIDALAAGDINKKSALSILLNILRDRYNNSI